MDSRQTPNQYSGQQLAYNNYQERSSYFNRGRNGAFEQTIFIRSTCTPRIVGKLITS